MHHISAICFHLGHTGEAKSAKTIQSYAGSPKTVQEEGRELRVFLEVLCLKLLLPRFY